jgi:hypothetical protein
MDFLGWQTIWFTPVPGVGFTAFMQRAWIGWRTKYRDLDGEWSSMWTLFQPSHVPRDTGVGTPSLKEEGLLAKAHRKWEGEMQRAIERVGGRR